MRVLFLFVFLSALAQAADLPDACIQGFPRLAPGTGRGNFDLHLSDVDTPDKPKIKIMSKENAEIGTQPGTVEAVIKAMKDGTFDYDDPKAVISGVFHEGSGVLFVSEGHHRLCAALHLANDTGNWSYFKKLVEKGNWHPVVNLPNNRSMLPFDGSAKDRKKLLHDLTPGWWAFGISGLAQ